MFYVDNDWNLPVGYVGFDYSVNISWNFDRKPIVFTWFNGNLESARFEARLLYSNQEIASTDDSGWINTSQRRGEDCFQNTEICRYNLWEF